jgi:hypothetical protein
MLNPPSSKVLYQSQRTMIFLKRGIYVSTGARCCSDHMYQDRLTAGSFDKICVSQADRLKMDSRGNLSNWLIDILIKYSGPRVIYYADSEYHHDISP